MTTASHRCPNYKTKLNEEAWLAVFGAAMKCKITEHCPHLILVQLTDPEYGLSTICCVFSDTLSTSL